VTNNHIGLTAYKPGIGSNPFSRIECNTPAIHLQWCTSDDESNLSDVSRIKMFTDGTIVFRHSTVVYKYSVHFQMISLRKRTLTTFYNLVTVGYITQNAL
jgi:hypothetical protein